MKFCKDCAHYVHLPMASPSDQCRSPKNQSTDLVNGKVKYIISASTHRSLNTTGKFCGSEGNWWEPKSITVTTNVPTPVKKPWYNWF